MGSGEQAMARPRVSVIVPFFGDEDGARSMLAALSRLRLADGDEMLVADNTGAGVVEAARAAGAQAPAGLRVVPADLERSSYYARNAAAEQASGEWLLFLDSDTRADPGLLDAYLAEAVGDRVGVIAGGVAAAPDQEGLVPRYARSRGHISEEWHMQAGPYPAGVTANLMARRSAWDGLGGFQEGVLSGADVEFCWRAQRLGWELVHRPEARVEHVHPEALGDLLSKARRHMAGRVWVNRLYRGALPRPKLVRPLVRSAGGALAWALTLRFERARFKLLDGRVAAASWRGYLLGDNRAERPGAAAAAGEPRIVLWTDAFPARSETFVYNEALRLREVGWGLRVESCARPVRPERAVARELQITHLEDDPFRDKVRDLAWLLARHPLGSARDLAQRRRWAREEHPWRLASLAPAARRLARGGERHLHVHFAAGAALHALRLTRLVGGTYSVAPHAYEIFQKPRNLAEKLERAAFVVTDCDYNVEHLRALVASDARDRIHRLVLGVDGQRFRRSRAYPGGRTVMSVGRLVEKKGFADLVDASALLRERGAVDRVLICGEGPLRDELLERIEAQGLDGTVALVQGWGADEVRALLEEADLFTLPCVVAADGDRDSMPVVVKEALAMELPVVGSDEVGMPEMVSEEWGRLVPPSDPAALADAIAEVLGRSAGERRAMGVRGREFVLEFCNIERETAKLEELIRGTLAQRR